MHKELAEAVASQGHLAKSYSTSNHYRTTVKKLDPSRVMLWLITGLLSVTTYFASRMITENDKTKDAVLELRVDVAVIKSELQKLTEGLNKRR
jgi:hypothetical protein